MLLSSYAKPLTVAVAALLALATIGQAHANGAHIGTEGVLAGAVGPYVLQVESLPLGEDLHLTVYVTGRISGEPVSDAQVIVTARGPGDDPTELGPVSGVPDSLLGPHAYAMTIGAQEPGEWALTLTVKSTLGSVMVDIPVTIREPSGSFGSGLFSVLLWAVAGAGGVAVLVLALRLLASRKR